MLINTLFWGAFGFWLGAIPFSVLIGKAVLKKDIRLYGDGNPGGTNVIRAGGRLWGIVAILMDYFKGALPVGLAHFFAGMAGWSLVIVALAPVLGHAYSPFLGYRGGKAVAVTFGVWTGLTLWIGPVLLGLSLGLWFALLIDDAWAVAFSMVGLLAYLLLSHADLPMMTVWLGNAFILAWKHRAGLVHWPELRPWLKRTLS